MSKTPKESLTLLVEDEAGNIRKVLDRDGYAVDLLAVDLDVASSKRRVLGALKEAVDEYWNS
jgi:hypothetical protein